MSRGLDEVRRSGSLSIKRAFRSCRVAGYSRSSVVTVSFITFLCTCQTRTGETLPRMLLSRGDGGSSHMWTAPNSKCFFGSSNDLVSCGHMPGLLMRSICPLALMKSDDRDPYQSNELFAHVAWRVIPDLRW